MGREFRILNQLNSGFPYCPEAYAHCTDTGLIGGEFYVMERVKGIILRSDIPAELNLDASRTEALCKSFIDRLVELHQVDYTACGLADLGKPEGYVQRQIEGWTSRYEKALTPDAPRWETVTAWLHEKKCPPTTRALASCTTTTGSTTSSWTQTTPCASSVCWTGRWPPWATHSWTWAIAWPTGSKPATRRQCS